MRARHDVGAPARIEDRLHDRGVRLAIDYFGTGYSSLGQLRRFPVDKVKIDRSFVAGLGRDRDADAIVRAAIKLAHALGMVVVAEGVETDEQLTFLRAEECDAIQDFWSGEPSRPWSSTCTGWNLPPLVTRAV